MSSDESEHTHLSPTAVLAIARGLVPEHSPPVRAHLDGCAACRESLERATRDHASGGGDDRGNATVATAVQAGPSAALLQRASPEPNLGRGTNVGRYMILETLGEGGMGVVYAAYDPELNRKVALKLLQTQQTEGPAATGGASRGQARLVREAQALAQLSHPNVVAVYDVGTFSDRVFVAMEMVDGVSLRAWLKERSRPGHEIVRQFLAAGEGLRAAHGAGLVHRDFKPDNVLVGRDGRVRVMDFGLARHSDGREGADIGGAIAAADPARPEEQTSPLDTPLTQAGTVLGTPAYMAPEQYRGGSADARTDQFSFCVALYEALYGARPFSTRADSTSPERWRLPPPPRGARVSARLRRILVRGLNPDPAQRYLSMAPLLEELARDPAVAQRRYAAVAVALALVGGGAVFAQRSKEQSAQLCRGGIARLDGVWGAARKAEIATRFDSLQTPFAAQALEESTAVLDRYSSSWTSMHQEACEATRIRGEQSDEMLSLRMICLDQRLGELRALSNLLANADKQVVEKAVQASAQLTALSECADLEALRAPLRPPKDEAVRARVEEVRAEIARGRVLMSAAKLKDALEIADGTVAAAAQLAYAPVEAEALVVRGTIKIKRGDFKGAAADLTEADFRATSGRDDALAARASIGRVHSEREINELERSRLSARRAWALLDRIGDRPALEAELYSAEGLLLRREGKMKESLEMLKLALALREQTDGKRSWAAGQVYGQVGVMLYEMGRPADALPYYEASLDAILATLGSEHPEAAMALNNRGSAEDELGHYRRALLTYKEALRINEATLGPAHWWTAVVRVNHGNLLTRVGLLEDGRTELETGLEAVKKVIGAEHPVIAQVLLLVSDNQRARGRLAEALETANQALAINEKSFGQSHPNIASALLIIGELKTRLGRARQALPQLQRSLAIQTATSPEPLKLAPIHSALGAAHFAAGDGKAAKVELEKALAYGAGGMAEHPRLVDALKTQGELALRQADAAAAASSFEQALAIQSRTYGAQSPTLADLVEALARAKAKLGAADDARALAERAKQLRTAAAVVAVEAP